MGHYDTEHKRQLHRDRQATYRANNPDKVRARKKKEYEANKVSYVLRAKMRQEHVARATPSWLTAKHLAEILEVYEEARKATQESDELYVVDHIWPLRGQNSCGLHVPWNLRVITGAENDAKGNKEPA